MHTSVNNFVKNILTKDIIYNKCILEVGSYNVNGSVRDWIEKYTPSSYYGIDIVKQDKYVDEVICASSISNKWCRKFDIIISTEMLEHCEDWKAAVNGMKDALKYNGILIITTRSNGFPFHCPPDRWRYSIEQFRDIFSDFYTISLESDGESPGVFYAGRKINTIKNNLDTITPTPMSQPPYHSEQSFNQRMFTRRNYSNKTIKNLKCWYHIACMGDNWKRIVEEQLLTFNRAGLTPVAAVLGGTDDLEWVKKYIQVDYHSDNILEYETSTLELIWRWCKENYNSFVLYTHTKGASNQNCLNKIAWRRLMARHVICKWKSNLEKLSIADILGVNWRDDPKYPHFSGNFWMARADWIANLQSPTSYRMQGGPVLAGNPWVRMSAEMWLGSKPWHHVESLYCRNENLWTGNRVFELLGESIDKNLDYTKPIDSIVNNIFTKETVFLHIPKTAGTSIMRFFDLSKNKIDFMYYGHGKESDHIFPNKNAFIFTFVRNPFDRLVSAWQYLRYGGNNEINKAVCARYNLSNSSFSSFVDMLVENKDNIMSDVHLRPQSFWFDRDRGIAIEFIGRFENLEKDLLSVCERVGIKFNPLEFPHINSSNHSPWETFYTPELKKQVREIYKEDFERFGY